MPLSTEAAMSRKIQFICLFVLLGLLLTATQPGFAQSPPLNFGNNFFVTGDYIVAGAYGMTANFKTTNGVSYAVGTISVPDSQNMGITGTKQVPVGAQIVAALLYWQTVEKVGAPGSGQNGYFRPLLSGSGGPAAPGYLISGTNVTGSKTVSWSSGGCGGTSTGKVLVTYRADVAGGLPVDASGNSVANGNFEVRLPSAGNSTPLTLGATLVVIYRILSGAGGPTIPLSSIVIYDGDYAQGNAQLTMTQKLQGFYDADQNPVSRLTHIVGSGQSNKFQTVYLGSGANSLLPLPSLYGKQLPPFPGWYGNWDNPTWTFTNASMKNPGVLEDDGNATTQVKPFPSNQGCVSWGAVILSTTVKDPDNDGILKSWKTNQGYCDYAVNPSCTGSQDGGWIPLPGAKTGQKDIFLQYDYMCSKVNGPPQDPNNDNAQDNSCAIGGNDYSFDPRQAVDQLDSLNAAQKVVKTFNNHKGSLGTEFVLHAMPGNAISENQAYDSKGNIVPATCNDTDLTCPFPNEPGTVGFREGLAYIKNQTIEPQTGLIGCDPSTNVKCVAVFPHGKKDSYHYALFSHGVGLPNWFLSDASISSVSQSGNTVTFTTSSAHGLSPIAGDSLCSAANGYIGRVTVVFAITNQNLNGTYCATPVGNPPSAKKFAIIVGGSATTANYSVKTDPNLAVANGQVTSMSGYSDVGGQNSVISLGYGGWGPPQNVNPPSEGNKWNIKAGTFMHELGHTLALTHGGTFYNNLANNPPDYTPNFEVNCKPNVQSVMSYVFQFDLLQAPGPANRAPVKVLDYSEDPQSPGLVNTLTENSPQPEGYLTGLSYPYTSWFQLSSGPVPPSHCDGTPTVPTENAYSYTNQPVGDFFWGVDPITNKLTGNDINFNGNANDLPMHPHNEWEGTPAANGVGPSPGVDLRQVSAAGTVSTIGPGGEAGGIKPAGGGGGIQPAGGGGGIKPAGGGGGIKPAGGGGLSAEITHNQANSYPRPPQNLFIQQEEASPRLIDLNWFAPSFGVVDHYKVYRSDAVGPFVKIASVPGSQTMYTDTVTCNTGGYHYRVTAVTNNDQGQPQESSPSNTVPATGDPLLTGCYTVGNFSVPASAVQGSSLQVSWTLTDDFYVTPPTPWASAISTNPVTRLAANTLVAIGPFPGNCTSSGRTTLVADGTPTNAGTVDNGSVDTFTPNANNFTFTWNRTDAFCAGSYTFELDLDHVNGAPAQRQTAATVLQLGIDINDQDTPRIDTLTLLPGVVGLAYKDTLTEDGGTAPFMWNFSGSLPPGISQQAQYSPTLSGTTCAAGSYNLTATVIDSKANSGTQGFTLQINQANTTTGVTSNAKPSSVFQQMVTFTVTVAPQYSCTPTGTVTLLDGGSPIASASNLPLSGGIATFTTAALSVGVHNITANYSGDANFNSSNSAIWSQTVNQASTSISLSSVSPSPAFVGQPITVSYTFGVVAPGGSSPIAPSGNITVTASDNATPPHNSSCMTAAALPGGMCTLSPTPTAAGTYTLTINYPGDGDFVGSGANGNYTVYQLVFTTQPSNTGVGLTMPAVQVAAQDDTNTTLATFTGSITLAIGSGPGTLSGTTTQNAVAGVATFSDLSINKMANAYTLVASLTGTVAATVTSNAFNVDAVLFAGTDQNTLSGNPLPDQLGRSTINGTTVTGSSILSVPYHINGMAQGGNFLYAGDPNSNTLQRIDFNGNALSSVTAGFPNTCCNEDMAFDAANSVLWHANNSETTPPSGGEIDKLDPTTGAVITAYPLPDVGGMTFVGNTIWITQWSAQEVGTWDPSTNTFTMKFATPANAGGLAYDPVNGILWVGLQGGSVVPYDLNGNQQGPGFSPFGAITDTVDGLEFVSQIP